MQAIRSEVLIGVDEPERAVGDCEFIPITHPPKPVSAAAGSETTGYLASPQSRLAGFWGRFLDVLLADGPRGLLRGSAIAVLLYVLAMLGREALHLIIPGPLRYLTFFPALMAAGFLCGLLPSMALTAAFAVTGFVWIDAADAAPVVVRLTLALVFVLAGAAVITPAAYAVRARRHLKIRDERLALLNAELRHRIKNLFSVVCSICTQTIKATSDKEEISRNIVGRIQAIASAQDFLSIASNEGSHLHRLTEAIISPLCPNPAQLEMTGPSSVTLPSDLTTSFALVLHELATNAVKYGPWQSHGEGKVAIAWRLDGDQLWFHWRERSARLISPAGRGFGSKVIRQGVPGAQVAHLLHSDGAECTIILNI